MSDIMNNSAASIGEPKTKDEVQGENSWFQGVSNWFSDMGNSISSWWNNEKNFLNPGNWQKKIQDLLGITAIKDSVNNATSQGKIAYTKSGIPYDETNIDSQINALMQEYAYKRDDESYSRLIKQLKANGINPAIALSNNASPMSSDSGFRSNYNLTDKDQINSALKAGSILALLLGLLMKGK